MSTWGEYKDDRSALLFQKAILSTKARPHTVMQYDTLLAQLVVIQNEAWTRRITNPLTNEQLQHPLQNNLTILQIFSSQHYTTLITDNKKYYHYDGPRMGVPEQVIRLHNHLRQWYGTSEKPLVLRRQTPEVLLPHTPRQTGGWTCAMHMILTSLSAIYHDNVPTL